mmetsp:Transcript_1787/g.4298  ORF Transcript_1787/g.4298 Transcript_1787/m.4298 type:complete len:188 (+) Transcript_1787:2-565(+)
MTVTLSFESRADASSVVTAVLKYKKYQLLVSLGLFLKQQPPPTPHRIDEEDTDPVAKIVQGKYSPPPRPESIPAAQNLPRMVTNDHGEVFWYISRKRKSKPSKPPTVGPPESESASPGPSGPAAGDLGSEPTPLMSPPQPPPPADCAMGDQDGTVGEDDAEGSRPLQFPAVHKGLMPSSANPQQPHQ